MSVVLTLHPSIVAPHKQCTQLQASTQIVTRGRHALPKHTAEWEANRGHAQEHNNQRILQTSVTNPPLAASKIHQQVESPPPNIKKRPNADGGAAHRKRRPSKPSQSPQRTAVQNGIPERSGVCWSTGKCVQNRRSQDQTTDA